MPTAAENFADALRYWMDKRELNQAELALKSGVGQTTISLYLRPAARDDTARGTKGSPTLANIETLATALQVDVVDLLRPASRAERDLLESVRALVEERASVVERPRAKRQGNGT
jgi:transcriptional regulator with XRE-family HTH domain